MTAAETKRLLQKIGLRPQQAAGQNFLLDESVAEAMVTAAGVVEGDTVLEIGPGLGILTEALMSTGASVVAIELDRRLAAHLRRRWPKQPKLTLVEGDVFRVRLGDYVRDGAYKLVANLPYSATSLVFRNFLTLSPRPMSMTVMVQRDVAQRITARPGSMSVLALMVQHYCRPAMLFDVPPISFYPAPMVHSTVLYADALQPIRPDEDARLFRLIRAGFSARRKQLHNTLAASLKLAPEKALQLVERIGKKPTVRAQELSLENWLTLANLLS